MIKAYFDGSCWPNPGGKAAYGFLVEEDGRVLHEGFGLVSSGPLMSNNVAEYEGLRNALVWLLKDHSQEPIDIFGDSQLVVTQMRGQMKAKKGLYVPYYHATKKLLPLFKSLQISWISREENTRADELSRRIYGPTEQQRMTNQFFQTVRLPQETKPTVSPAATDKEADLFTSDPVGVIKS